VSDPGAELVAAARARGIQVVTIPGPTAVAAALAVSGLAATATSSSGSCPARAASAAACSSSWPAVSGPWCCSKRPTRGRAARRSRGRVRWGADRPASVSREMTKVFEETRAGTLAELAGYYAEAPPRGEVTVVVAGTGKPRPPEAPIDPEARARTLLAQGMTRKDVAEQVAQETGISRNTAYRLVNEL